MLETEETLLETLKDWEYLKKNLKRLRNSLQEKSYKITTSYSEASSFSSGLSHSKVETYVFSIMGIKDEIKEIETTIKMCTTAYKKANLTYEERLTIDYTRSGRSLLRLSRKLNMAQAKIYRIRDRAVKKMFLAIQKEVKNR